MKAETIAVGTELLIGQIANTNAQYLSQQLNSLGVDVYYHTVVGDNLNRVVDIISIAASRSNYIFITGGLGPTEDDLTREAVSLFSGRKLIEDIPSKNIIMEYFSKNNYKMPISNLKQATFPEGSIILKNERGTAPGFILEINKKYIIVLPGPPSEMQYIFENEVIKHLFEERLHVNRSKFIKIFGIGESSLEEALLELIDNQTSPSIATYVKDGEITLRLTAKTNKLDKSDDIFEPVLSKSLEILGDKVFSTEDENLAEVTGKLLIEKNITIAIAESCTGGGLSKKLTSVGGISSVFLAGFVTYSNLAKINLINVNPATIDTFGAVSSQTALEMSQGALAVSQSDIAISITGVAGPTGGTPQKPVGLVYIGFSSKTKSFYKELRLTGDRERIRNLTTLHALDMIRRYILNDC